MTSRPPLNYMHALLNPCGVCQTPDYDGGAVVIVATIQAFRVEETEGRKVYEANGELFGMIDRAIA